MNSKDKKYPSNTMMYGCYREIDVLKLQEQYIKAGWKRLLLRCCRPASSIDYVEIRFYEGF